MTPVALDITVASVILLSTIVAYMRGIIKEMFTIVGVFMAAFIAYKCGHLLIPSFNEWLHVPKDGNSPKTSYVLFGMLSPSIASKASSYGSAFLFVLITVTLLGRMFANWVKAAGMEMIDKGFGAVFGFARGFFVVFLIYVPFNYLVGAEKFPDWAKDSYSVGAFSRTFTYVSKEYKLDEKIKDSEDGLTIKFDKIKPDDSKTVNDIKNDIKSEVKDKVEDAKEKLKEAIEQEEKSSKSSKEEPKASDKSSEVKSVEPMVAPAPTPAAAAPAPVIDKSGEISAPPVAVPAVEQPKQ